MVAHYCAKNRNFLVNERSTSIGRRSTGRGGRFHYIHGRYVRFGYTSKLCVKCGRSPALPSHCSFEPCLTRPHFNPAGAVPARAPTAATVSGKTHAATRTTSRPLFNRSHSEKPPR
jgi:hypothetical protein